MDKPIKVRIFDGEYLIRSEEDESRVHQIAEYVNDKFRRVRDTTEGLSEKKMAILVALDIASEYFQVVREREDAVSEIQKRVRALNYQIDSVTGQDMTP